MTDEKNTNDEFKELENQVQHALFDYAWQNGKKEIEIKIDEGKIKFCFLKPGMWEVQVLEIYGENTVMDFYKKLLKKFRIS